MTVIFDHLTAIIVGVVVLLALATLQIRDRLAAVEGAVTDASESQAISALDVVSTDLENTMSETMALEDIGAYRCRLTRSPDGQRTTAVEVPTLARRTAGAPPRPAHVRYELVPEGDAVRVARQSLQRYSLTRAVDWGDGYRPAATVAQSLTDFDVTFRGRVSETADGAPPLRFTGIAVSLDLALPTPGQVAADQAATGAENRAQVSLALRPPNLTVGA